VATIAQARWLDFVRAEYLDSFIKDGGTSIKFAVPEDEVQGVEIENEIMSSALDAGYLVARISSAHTRVQMIDQLFFRVCEQIPWRQLSEIVILHLARENGYSELPAAGAEPLVNRLAEANSIDPELLTMEARRWISKEVLPRRSLAKEFRVAVTQLCLAELSGGPDGESRIEVITDWLSGRNTSVSAVKPYQIFSRVTRSNARRLLASLLLWTRYAGFPGLAVIMDISRVTMPRNPRDGLLSYTKPQMLDAYEVLRQFIDATDLLKGLFLVVMANQEFLDPESSSRGIGAYQALKFRVYDEIRDQRLVNPMVALVRLSSREQAT
jgi:P-loop Domain of unknown function (DUF2791)